MSDYNTNTNNDIVNNYAQPNALIEKLHESKDKLPFVLENFTKSFVLYNKNPEDNEYKQIFQTDKSNLDKIMHDLFLLENNVTTNINKLNSNLEKLYIEIEVLKEENKQLKKKLQLFNQHSDTTNEMIDNFKEFYEIQYLRNWAIALTILISVGIMTSIFKPTTIKI
jgi:uncharacterized phage infection (PIP) family protein YhgE